MSKIQIFVEGKEDKKLTDDYLSILPVDTNKIIVDVSNGWTNLKFIKNKLLENSNKGGVNLLIFDADTDCEARRQEIFRKKIELGLSFELFLLPTNQDPGALEELLVEISNPIHHGIFDCFEEFKLCLTQRNGRYMLPDNKAKIFAYLEALSAETTSEKRDFLDNNLWNLAHPAFNPLRTFILNYCPPIQP